MLAIEFAIVVLPFLTIAIFSFELASYFFNQELLDTGLHSAAKQIQVGSVQNVADGSAFVANYLWPAMGSLVKCSNISVKVQAVTFSGGQDYYNITTGRLPTNARTLDLSGFGSGNFCNAGPSQFVLITAIYISPTMIGGLLPNLLSVAYAGQQVDAIMSQAAVYTENYVTQAAIGNRAPAC